MTKLLDPSTLNIVLTLLFLFQWYKQHSKEQSMKNILFSLRRILLRPQDSMPVSEKTLGLVDIVDAALATIDGRPAFIARVQEVISAIRKRFGLEAVRNLDKLPKEMD